jgi:hypothetical protein
MNLTLGDGNELLAAYNVVLPENDSECQIATAYFVFQMTIGLFIAIGCGPFLLGRRQASGILALLRSNAVVWSVVTAAYNAMTGDPKAVAAATVPVLAVLLRTGFIWVLLRYALNEAGWWVAGAVVSRILRLALAPPGVVLELLVSFTLWAAELYAASEDAHKKCGT